MQTITIPQSLTRTGELIVVPKREYEELRELQREFRAVPIAQMTAGERRALRAGQRQIARGDYYSLDELKQRLARRHRKEGRFIRTHEQFGLMKLIGELRQPIGKKLILKIL